MATRETERTLRLLKEQSTTRVPAPKDYMDYLWQRSVEKQKGEKR